MLANKIDLYDTWGKASWPQGGPGDLHGDLCTSRTQLQVMNCGGGGSCGTCLVEIADGAELCSARNGAEDRKLKVNECAAARSE